MMMTLTPVTDEGMARAFRAVREQNRILTAFRGAARAMTGIPNLQLRSGEQSQTDGQTFIVLRTRIELGDHIDHVRSLCALREPESSMPLCPACRDRDETHRVLFHEMAHIIFESFEKASEADKTRTLAQIVLENQGGDGTRLAKIQENVRRYLSTTPKVDYMVLASMVSPFMPGLINCLEDARVNRCMYRARPGTYHMFRYGLYNVFTNGWANMDGSRTHWIERDENAQITLGCLSKMSGLDPKEGWLSPAVLEALADPELSDELANLAESALTAGDVFRGSFKVLDHLRRLGFLRTPTDPEDDQPEPEPEPEDEQEGDESDDSQDGESDPGMETPGQGDSEASDDAADAEPDSGAGTSDPDVSAGDDTDDLDNVDESGTGGDDNDAQLDADTDAAADEADSGGEPEAEDSPADSPQPGEQSPAGSDEQTTDWSADSHGTESSETEPADEASDSDADAGEQQDDDSSVEDDAAEKERAAQERMNNSSPEAVNQIVLMFGGHDPENEDDIDDTTKRQVGVAVIQADQFDNPSDEVSHFNVHTFENPTERTARLAWRCLDDDYSWGACNDEADQYEIPEAMLGRSLLKMRTVFADNKKSKRSGEMRSGRVVPTRLASVMAGNTKVFNRAEKPGKKDYFVCLALDVSGSTSGDKLKWIKKIGMSCGNLLNRAGVKFAIYAHTGMPEDGLFEGDVFVVKEENQPWDAAARNRLAKLNSCGCNLDGHAIEFFRKRMDRSSATDKVMFYVTDGSMPESNKDDELSVLLSELKEFTKRHYTMIGVGIATDSPNRYGLDTIQIDDPEDVALLVRELEKRLAVRR
jgi:hypothetical protein